MGRVNWTESMLKFIRENNNRMTDAQLAIALSSLIGLSVSRDSVRNIREEKGYIKCKKPSTKDRPTS